LRRLAKRRVCHRSGRRSTVMCSFATILLCAQ
jgi:hypothetical protein